MKNIKFLTPFLILFIAFSFTSCDNEPLDNALQLDDFIIDEDEIIDPNAAFTATIDGVPFASHSNVATYTTVSGFGNVLSLVGLKINGQNIAIQIANPSVGTFVANNDETPTTNVLLTYTESLSNDLIFTALNPDTDQSTGTITITSFDLVTKKVSGTFSFTGYLIDSTSLTREITNGVFTDILFEDTTTTEENPNDSIFGTYKLTNFNTFTPTDLNNDGTATQNQLLETNCFNDMFLTLNEDHTFTADSKGVEIISVNTVETMECYIDPDYSGTWTYVDDGIESTIDILTLTYTEAGVTVTQNYYVNGFTLTANILDQTIVGVDATNNPVYLNSDIAIIYTKQ